MWQRGAPVMAHARDITLTGDARDWFTESGTRRVALKAFETGFDVAAMFVDALEAALKL